MRSLVFFHDGCKLLIVGLSLKPAQVLKTAVYRAQLVNFLSTSSAVRVRMNQSRPELCRFRPAKIIGSSFSRVESTEFVWFAAVKPRQLILTTAGALGMRTFGLLVASLVLAHDWVSIILNDSFLLNNSSNDYFLRWLCWRLINGGGGTAHSQWVVS